MTAAQMRGQLQIVKSRLGELLTSTGELALDQAISAIDAYREVHKGTKKAKKRAPPWQFVIEASHPLEFCETDKGVIGQRLQIDLFCHISEPNSQGEPTGEHIIVVRVWALADDLWCREEWDAESVWDRVSDGLGKRVMLRFHFDFANPGQPGPRFHFHIGGRQHPGEFCWYPEGIDVPRFVHHPIGLLMACEFIVQTFYPNQYARICEEGTWVGGVRTGEKTYLRPYMDHLNRYCRNTGARSFLQHVWNT